MLGVALILMYPDIPRCYKEGLTPVSGLAALAGLAHL